MISSNPFFGATGVPTIVFITFQFDKPIDPYTVNAANIPITDGSTNQQVPGTLSLSANRCGRRWRLLRPSPSAVRSAFLNAGVRDLAGNPLNANGTTFTAGFAPSTTAPHVLMTNPDNGLSGVPVNAVIQVLFDEPLQTSSINAVSLIAGGAAGSGVANSLSAGNTVLTITPPSLLLASTAYSVNLSGVTDLANNAISPSAITFSTSPGVRLIPTTYLLKPSYRHSERGNQRCPGSVCHFPSQPDFRQLVHHPTVFVLPECLHSRNRYSVGRSA